MTILVTGARGQIGQLVVQGVRHAGVPVRASSRTPRPGEFPDDVQPVRLDLTDPGTLQAALEGVNTVFLYAQPDQIGAFTTAASAAGVDHVVLLSSASVLFPDANTNPIARLHATVEDALQHSELAWTFLRPAYFATNTLRWTTIRTDRTLRTAFPDGLTPTVHERDIADVAVAALTDDTHRGAAYPLLGSRPTTVREQVATIADAIHAPVTVQQIEVDEYRDELLEQVPDSLADRLIAARGNAPVLSPDIAQDAVHDVLGRQPLPFSVWATDHADDFR